MQEQRIRGPLSAITCRKSNCMKCDPTGSRGRTITEQRRCCVCMSLMKFALILWSCLAINWGKTNANQMGLGLRTALLSAVPTPLCKPCRNMKVCHAVLQTQPSATDLFSGWVQWVQRLQLVLIRIGPGIEPAEQRMLVYLHSTRQELVHLPVQKIDPSLVADSQAGVQLTQTSKTIQCHSSNTISTNRNIKWDTHWLHGITKLLRMYWNVRCETIFCGI